jgi:hypothetical protein
MARFSVQMTFETPAQRTPSPQQVTMVLSRGTARYVVGDGTIAVTAVVRAECAPEAALRLSRAMEREERLRGRGPVRLASWTAMRSVPVLAGRGRRQRFSGGGFGWDDGEGDGDGTAGVREPRRPKPSPGTMSAALDEPKDLWGRFPA